MVLILKVAVAETRCQVIHILAVIVPGLVQGLRYGGISDDKSGSRSLGVNAK